MSIRISISSAAFFFLLRLIFCVHFALKTHDSFEQKIRMKSKKAFIQSFLFFAVTAAIIAYFFPREGKFPYQFHEGKPWRYDLLTAPNDFPIYKSDQEIKAEKDSIRARFEPYFRYANKRAEEKRGCWKECQ